MSVRKAWDFGKEAPEELSRRTWMKFSSTECKVMVGLTDQ